MACDAMTHGIHQVLDIRYAINHNDLVTKTYMHLSA